MNSWEGAFERSSLGELKTACMSGILNERRDKDKIDPRSKDQKIKRSKSEKKEEFLKKKKKARGWMLAVAAISVFLTSHFFVSHYLNPLHDLIYQIHLEITIAGWSIVFQLPPSPHHHQLTHTIPRCPVLHRPQSPPQSDSGRSPALPHQRCQVATRLQGSQPSALPSATEGSQSGESQLREKSAPAMANRPATGLYHKHARGG